MSEALRNIVGDDDCLKPSLADMKLEPETENHLDMHSAVRKSDKIRQIVNEHTSAESQKTVDSILDQVGKLTALDKLLLYLKLPSGRPNDIDPLRQPLNPLGSRSEIQLTINWIRTHLEEDPQVSLPKHEVYDEYIGYCSTNSVKPLSTADFGKVMKQVYPQVRPRRLGTRGNSRYCYAGLRKRLKLDMPLTPDIGTEGRKSEGCDSEEELNSAASFLIREWVEKLLGVKFESLSDLAYHLLEKMYVDNRSVAAFTLLSSASKFNVLSAGGSATNVKSNMASPPGESKHRDTQLQLQRKLQEREQQQREPEHRPPDQKRKLQEQDFHGVPQNLLIGKRSKGEEDMEYGNLDYEGPGEKNCDNQNRYSVVVPNNQNEHYVVNGALNSDHFETQPQDFTNYSGERIEMTSPIAMMGSQNHSRPPSSISLDKLPRKKQALVEVAASMAAHNAGNVVCLDTSTGQQVILNTNNHTSVIKAGEKPKNKYKEVDESQWGEPKVVEVKGESVGWEGGLNYDEPADLTTLGRVNSWEKGVLGSGGSSSDAQEEELVRYFSQTSEVESMGPEDNKNEKLSQLRQLLEKNLKSPTLGVGGGGAFKRTSLPPREPKLEVVSSVGFTLAGEVLEPTITNSTLNLNTNLSTRRRVSFNPLIVSDPAAIVTQSSVPGGICPIPPSPGSRRRHFSFQPISPRQSLPQSPPASPFISPRSTPVHMLRSRHSSGSALPLHLLPGNVNNGGRQQHPSGSGSDISRAATFGSASESSTPFISPQGTPIPFNRSRHNSAQGRLCRSRHSSGVPIAGGGYRYQTMPYSPMALNNLNNPFSPQPSTPICQPDMAEPSYQSTNQFVSPPEDPRSRHSSAGSDTAPRSAPLSPYNANTAQHSQMSQGRQRHQSAGQLPAATATIHYRPPNWQPNGEQTLQTEFSLNNEVSSLLTDNMSERVQYNYSQSQPATPGGGLDNGGPPPGYSYSVIGVTNTGGNHSHHSSYRNTPIPQEFQGDNGDMELGHLVNSVEEEIEPVNQKGKENNDDLDLALDALRDCDTDFIKFDQIELQENGSTVNN
eukprot:GFUD01011492.1.p1 GENE.GFUD01011492.1~~GFUD01011492.1.p1  ORF type:complete len:1056 (-),score=265.28 GFUD01011492.1:937-4104(-)